MGQLADGSLLKTYTHTQTAISFKLYLNLNLYFKTFYIKIKSFFTHLVLNRSINSVITHFVSNKKTMTAANLQKEILIIFVLIENGKKVLKQKKVQKNKKNK